YERGDVEHAHGEGVFRFEGVAAPKRVIEHQFDVGLLRDNLVKPALIEIVAIDALIELAGLLVVDPVEINAIKVLEGGQLVAVETGGAGVGEVVLGKGPPVIELLTGLPGGDRIDPGVVTVAPEACEIDALAAFGLDQRGQFLERPEVIVRVDGGDAVEMSLDALVGFALPRWLSE